MGRRNEINPRIDLVVNLENHEVEFLDDDRINCLFDAFLVNSLCWSITGTLVGV